ncbi:MAG: hypothetical protein HC933_11010 [Pleurocapsa sp. SU_196_0]|nr:hypothetical protein [Pleurocapsa sp. SU_196_0]
MIDPSEYAITELSTTSSDDEAGLLTVTIQGEGAAGSNYWPEGSLVKLEYGWNGAFYADPWEGALETSEPEFSGKESLTLRAYGASFALRESNAPEGIKGTPRDIAEAIIKKAELTPDARGLPDEQRKVTIPDGASSWEALLVLARNFGLIVAERRAKNIFIGKKPAQDFVVNLHYLSAPTGITPTVTQFKPLWTRKRRLKKVTVIGVSARTSQRVEGIWEFKAKKRTVTVKDKRGRERKRTITDEDNRDTEVTLYLPVKSKTEAEAKAKSIGERGETRSRTATLQAPIAPVTNGETVRVDSADDELGRYAGAYYVTKVERNHLSGQATYSLEFKE